MESEIKRDMLNLIEGMETGKLHSNEAYNLVIEMDELAVYFSVKYLREKHCKAGSPTGTGDRLLSFLKSHDDVQKILRVQEKDSMVEWFNDSYAFHTFFEDYEKYVTTIVDKLES